MPVFLIVTVWSRPFKTSTVPRGEESALFSAMLTFSVLSTQGGRGQKVRKTVDVINELPPYTNKVLINKLSIY